MSATGAAFDTTTHPGAPTSTNELPALRLVLVYPPELADRSAQNRTTMLWPGLTLGRSQQAPGFSIAHATVSRHHAVVERKFGSVLCLRDLESRNGTHVNGKQASGFAVPLTPQTVVRLGDVLGVVVDALDDDFHSDDILPGRGGRMAAARTILSRAAADDAPLLVWGETGTGKERVATEVHRRSGRIGSLVAVNCAELGPQLIESQLFGHERGAFTGAVNAKAGLFAAADRGTLFLDEIGELPLELQAKLLRVLQEGEVRPVGSVRPHRVNVRVIAATNRNLRQMVERGTFRQDLLARLSVWELALPALRERREDVFEWLTLLQQHSARPVGATPGVDAARNDKLTTSERRFSPNVAEHLLLHPWLDNLRGLDRLCHRLGAASLDGPLGWRQASSLMPEVFTPPTDVDDSMLDASFKNEGNSSSPPSPELHGDAPPAHKTRTQARDSRPSREELLAVYEAHGRSIRATSRHFGKDRRQIYRWFSAYQLPREPSDD